MKLLAKNQINECVEILNKDGLLAFPTETVYGLAIKASSFDNYKHLVEVKNRPNDKPFTLMCSKIEQVKKFVEINELARKVINNFMPGPITLILKAKKDVPSFMDLNTGYIGIRIPNDKFVLNLIDLVNCPLLVPSANISNYPPAKTSDEVISYFKDSIEGVVEGKTDEAAIPSTVIKIENDKINLLRQGKLTLEMIMEKIKWK